jgi:hypothetical protein
MQWFHIGSYRLAEPFSQLGGLVPRQAITFGFVSDYQSTIYLLARPHGSKVLKADFRGAALGKTRDLAIGRV